MRKYIKGIIFTIAILLLLLFFGYYIGYSYETRRITLPKSHVFVCDNPKHLSDFDTWLKEDCNITWVPSYIVIKDGYVIGAFDGCIPLSEFDSQLGTALALSIPVLKLPDYYIYDLDNSPHKVSDKFSNGFYILEIVWADCKDCIYQDEHYTNDIYKKYSNGIIYRYYIKTDKEQVNNLYSSKQ